MASKFSFNILRRLNTALRSSMAMGQVKFDSWLTIHSPLTDSHKSLYCVSKTAGKNFGDVYNLLV